ncbi:Hypothetical protein HVR_LOCUS330 [uncultured virus]|nr:Hypothetical protein HVR_LOCUS330 [uncultured virus]
MENYNDALTSSERREKSYSDNLQFPVRLIGDDVRWICIPQTCRTENDQSVSVEENGWSPISLNEVNLILLGPEALISSVIINEAKERGIELLKMMKRLLSFSPTDIDGGLLFCRKWVSSNTVAAQKIVLSETPGDTRVIIGEGDQSVTLNKIIALYKILDNDKVELHLYDETGGKHVLNFDVEHDKHPEHKNREIPNENPVVNYCVVNFVTNLIASQMSHNPENRAIAIEVKDGETARRLTLVPGEFDYKDGKLYLGDKELFEIDLSPGQAANIFRNT